MNAINRAYFRFRNFFSRHFPRLYSFCDGRKSIVKFFIAGCFAGLTDLVFLFVFHGLVGWPIVLSTSLAFILAFLVSFSLQKFWTFRNYSQDKVISQLFLYLFNAVIGLNLNGFLMHFFVNRLNIWYILAQIAVNLILSVYNYLIYRFVIFRKN